MLRSDIDNLGELCRRKDQKFNAEHQVSAVVALGDDNLYFPGRRSRSRARLVHQLVWRFLLEHPRTRFSRHHGDLRVVARQARLVQLDYVERHWTGDFRNGRLSVRHVFVAHQHHRDLRRVRVIKTSAKSNFLYQHNYQFRKDKRN